MTRLFPAICIVAFLAPGAVLRADVTSAGGSLWLANKPASGSDLAMARLMPSYSLSFLASAGTPESALEIAQQTAGAAHMTSNQVFYAPLIMVAEAPGSGLGAGGDQSTDPNLPPILPPLAPVPAPGAFLLGLMGILLVPRIRRRFAPA
jgi:hypothetical protein